MRAGLIFVGSALAVLASGILYQVIGAMRGRRRFPPPGRIVSIDGCKLHFFRQGTGSPTVILESGIAATSLSWSYVQPLVAGFTSVMSYDRAGLGWSAGCGASRSLESLARQLEHLLAKADLQPPYVLVGHSFGGLVARSFAHRNPEQTAGLLLVDPVSVETWASCSPADHRRLRRGAKLSRRGAWLARFGVVRFAIAAALARRKRVAGLVTKASAGKAAVFLARLVGEVQKMPPEVLPAVASHWSRPKSFEAMAELLDALPGCARAAAHLSLSPGIPMVVLSAGTATESEVREREDWVAHAQRGKHVRVMNTGHWLHLERPDVVIQSIRELVKNSTDRSERDYNSNRCARNDHHG